MMCLFKGFNVCRYIYGVINFKSWLDHIFYLQNPFGVVLKSRGPILELSQGKHSQF